MSTNVLALLPELILTLTGVLVMLAEPCLKPASSRKPLGWIAIAGTVASLFASWYQVSLGTLHAFSNTIQVDAFSVLFHYVIGAVVLVTLLGSLDYFEGNASHAGEYFALLCFGAVGMMLMTCSVELLMVFIGLEISSITTYILCGFRKGQATGSESSIKYFLLGSFATAFFLYGIALAPHRPPPGRPPPVLLLVPPPAPAPALPPRPSHPFPLLPESAAGGAHRF